MKTQIILNCTLLSIIGLFSSDASAQIPADELKSLRGALQQKVKDLGVPRHLFRNAPEGQQGIDLMLLNGIWRGYEPEIAKVFEMHRGESDFPRELVFMGPGFVTTSDVLYGQCAGDAVWEGGVRLGQYYKVQAPKQIPVPLLAKRFFKPGTDEVSYQAIFEYLKSALGNVDEAHSELAGDHCTVVTQGLRIPNLLSHGDEWVDQNMRYRAVIQCGEVTGTTELPSRSYSSDMSRLVVHSHISIVPKMGPATTIGPLRETRFARQPGVKVLASGHNIAVRNLDKQVTELPEAEIAKLSRRTSFFPLRILHKFSADSKIMDVAAKWQRKAATGMFRNAEDRDAEFPNTD